MAEHTGEEHAEESFEDSMEDSNLKPDREKQYIESMVQDLKEDTVKMRIGINRNTLKTEGIDSLINYILSSPYTDTRLKKIYELNYHMHYRAEVFFTKRTITQLKSSGGLRLIRNLPASDSITIYDEQSEKLQNQFENFYWHQQKARDFEFKIFDPRYTGGTYLKYKLLNNDEKLMMEYVSWLSMTRISSSVYVNNLKSQISRANRIIAFLIKEYNLNN